VDITILIRDFSANMIVRVYPIAKVLERHHRVRVAGARLGKTEFAAYAGELARAVVPSSAWLPGFVWSLPGLLREVRGDLVYAFKPVLPSYGVALVDRALGSRAGSSRPLMLDVEDFDVGLYQDQPVRVLAAQYAFGWLRTDGLYTRLLMDRWRSRADAVTVVSNFLQRYYGGTKLPHGADTEVFDPARYDRKEVRRRLGLSERLWLAAFCGTVYPHKGMEDVLEALGKLGREEVKLLLVGGSQNTEYLGRLLAQGGERIIHVGYQPHEKMPEYLAAADAVVLPQRRSRHAEAQVPGKVFEAMAMGKPVIASRISDLPEILEGCGVLVEPNEAGELAAAVERLSGDPDEAGELGARARARCVERYSFDAMDEILQGVLAPFQ